MPSADSSFSQLYYIEESTFGQVPAGPPTLKQLRFTGESLSQATESTESQEIRSDRQVPDLVRTSVSASGDVNIEMSLQSHDDLLAGAFYDDWDAAVNVSETVSFADQTGGVFRITIDVPSGAFAPISVGSWINIANAADANNNGYKRVIAKPDNDTIDVDSSENAMVVAAADAVDITHDGFLKLGTTKKSFVIEKQFTDVTEYINFLGMRVSQLELSVATGSILTGRFGFLGLGANAVGATVGDGSPTVAPATEVLNAIDAVKAIREGGAAAAIDVQSLGVTINNNPRPKNAIGSVQAVDIGIGRALVTGTMVAYFEDRTLLEKYLNFTPSDFAFRLQDQAGNTMILDMPQMRFSQGNVVAGGIDQDVVVDMTFTAYLDPALQTTLTMTRHNV